MTDLEKSADGAEAWKTVIEHVGRIVVLWSRVENAVDLLLTVTGTPPGGRRGGFTKKLAILEGRLVDEAGVAQSVSFAVLKGRAIALAPARNVIAHWTITRVEMPASGLALSYVNPEEQPLTTVRKDHTEASLEKIADEIARLGDDLQIYLHRYHSSLGQMTSLDEAPLW